MKKHVLLIASLLLFAACSSPKYAYYFDYYDYNIGKAKADLKTINAQNMLPTPDTSPLHLDQDAAVTNAERRILNVEKIPVNIVKVTAEEKNELQKKYLAMSKAEKKEFRNELKTVVKKIIKAKKSGESIESVEELKAMDHDLKMALIFTIVAIILTALYGVNSIFWILGVIAFVVAIVFFIQWIARQ
jgi:hypothetical protein